MANIAKPKIKALTIGSKFRHPGADYKMNPGTIIDITQENGYSLYKVRWSDGGIGSYRAHVFNDVTWLNVSTPIYEKYNLKRTK